jgi:thiosulfate/3-mercaptopyruvate sulfurtransferase
MANYAHPETLVPTDWVAQHATDPKVRVVEVDVDTKAYDEGHVPGAIAWAWNSQLCDTVRRDILSKAQFEGLMASSGITNDTAVVIYGDNNNWFAAWAFWILKYYGHRDVRLLNGGRMKWLADRHEVTSALPSYPRATYSAQPPQGDVRALRDHILSSLGHGSFTLVDVRSPGEYSGELLAPANLPQEGAQRGGHIPGAANIPWSLAVREDGTFKPAEDLRVIYEGKGITPDKEVIAYCRIGERSSHTWFVLHYLLGYPDVRNYDGSWTEWGSLINAPIEK